MKQYLALSLALVVFAAACSKKDAPANVTPAKVDSFVAFNYSLDSVIDISTSNGSTVIQAAYLNFIAGTHRQKIAVTVSGLPAGVTDSIATAADSPTYSAFVVYTIAGATPGTYPVKITATSDSGLVKEATFNMIIANRKDLAVGKWQQTQWATDSNENGVMDPNEVTAFPLDKHFTFNADGSGAIISSNLGGTPLPVSWSLQNGDHEMKIGQAVYHIDTITTTDLILSITTGSTKTWILLKKEN